MSPTQLEFLASLAQKIPRLFQAIAEGNMHAEYLLGTRVVEGRQVKLVLVAEVVDPGDNPLSTHSQPMPGLQDGVADIPSTHPTTRVSSFVRLGLRVR